MKFSMVENDKSTFWDEVILGLIVVLCIAVGVVLVVTRPSIWIIDSTFTTVVGVLIAAVGVMFIPGLIYRLLTNDKKEK
ncbi:MAG: hypothetical protein J6B26_09100 [Agathobacter sp.]|nr:hypothetical protein [Agathobacter sp.]MBQ2283649.1 hypothetical protein [Agathobacter sp.]